MTCLDRGVALLVVAAAPVLCASQTTWRSCCDPRRRDRCRGGHPHAIVLLLPPSAPRRAPPQPTRILNDVSLAVHWATGGVCRECVQLRAVKLPGACRHAAPRGAAASPIVPYALHCERARTNAATSNPHSEARAGRQGGLGRLVLGEGRHCLLACCHVLRPRSAVAGQRHGTHMAASRWRPQSGRGGGSSSTSTITARWYNAGRANGGTRRRRGPLAVRARPRSCRGSGSGSGRARQRQRR